MEDDAVIVASGDECGEVGAGFGGMVVVQLNYYRSLYIC